MKSTMSMTKGKVWTSLIFFSMPIIFESLFQQLYNTVDAMLVGRFVGKQALSAVGSSTSVIIMLLIGFFSGVSTGVTVNVSHLFGKKSNNIEKTVYTGITISVIGGIIISALGIIFSKTILYSMNTPDEIMNSAVIYLKIYFVGLTPSLVYNTSAGILRAIGEPKRPLYYLIISSIINIILDVIFIIVFKLGVIGVAIATVISQIIGCLLIILYVKQKFKIKLRIYKEHAYKILKIGLPAGLQSIMFSVTNIVSQINMNKYGTDYVTAWTAYTKIGILFFTMISSYGIALMTFVGQNYGAKKYDRIHKGVRQCLIISLVTTAIICTSYMIFKEQLLSFFTNDEKVIKAGIEIINCIVPLYITYILMEILTGALKGMGQTFIPLCITGFGVCFLRIVWLIFVSTKFKSFEVIVLSLPLGWFITSIIIVFYYLYYIKTKLKEDM